MADDVLSPYRDTIADAITKLRTFKAAAGSAEMRRAQAALNYLGYAYSVLGSGSDNPAWDYD